jgi:hypothetical protein
VRGGGLRGHAAPSGTRGEALRWTIPSTGPAITAQRGLVCTASLQARPPARPPLTQLPPVPLPARPSRARTSPEQLEDVYRRLLEACQAGLPSPVSYNVLLWRSAVVMVPRSKECSGPCAIK